MRMTPEVRLLVVQRSEELKNKSFVAQAARHVRHLNDVYELEDLERCRIDTANFTTTYLSPKERAKMLHETRRYRKALESLPREIQELVRI